MSNSSIKERLFEQCDKFQNKEISLVELQSSIWSHGSALEGLGNDWQDLLNSLEAECESIIYAVDKSDNYEQGLEIIEKLKEFLNAKVT